MNISGAVAARIKHLLKNTVSVELQVSRYGAVITEGAFLLIVKALPSSVDARNLGSHRRPS